MSNFSNNNNNNNNNLCLGALFLFLSTCLSLYLSPTLSLRLSLSSPLSSCLSLPLPASSPFPPLCLCLSLCFSLPPLCPFLSLCDKPKGQRPESGVPADKTHKQTNKPPLTCSVGGMELGEVLHLTINCCHKDHNP